MSCLLGPIRLKKCRSNVHVACYALSKPRSVPLLLPTNHYGYRTATSGNGLRGLALTASSLATNKRGDATVAPREYIRSVRQLPQLAFQRVARPTVSKVSRGSVVVLSIMAGECVTLPGVTVHRRIWSRSKCRFNLRLRSLGNEFILLGQMHENGRMKPIDLTQIFLRIGAVIPDRGVDSVATHGCHEDHQRAEAIAEQGNLAVAFREIAYCVDGVLDVVGARVSIIGPIQTKAVLPIGLGGDIKVDARLLPPKQVWRDRNEALFRQFVAGLADVRVYPEQFLQNDHGGSRQGLRPCDVGGKSAVASFYGDVILHWVLLMRLR